MPSRTTSAHTSISNRSETPIHREGQLSPRSDHLKLSWRDYDDVEEEFFLEILECDDFWWEEEDKHLLF